MVAKNISDEDAEAAFRLALEGLSPRMVEANNDAAVWLVSGYQPGPLAEGTIQSLSAGAPAYPASTRMGILQPAIGNNIDDFLTGQTTAEQALAAVEAEYENKAREAGLVQ